MVYTVANIYINTVHVYQIFDLINIYTVIFRVLGGTSGKLPLQH